MVVAAAGVVLAGSVGLVLYALRGSVSMFLTPSSAARAHLPIGKRIELGGMVQKGSLRNNPDGSVEFMVEDSVSAVKVYYSGSDPLPPLFREGQGTVTEGAFQTGGRFVATKVLAKHDEKYMPRELTKALKQSGEWQRGQDEAAAAAAPSTQTKGPAAP